MANICKYAYDQEDDCCCNCNGETMVVDKETLSCFENCKGFEPVEEESIEEELPWAEPELEKVEQAKEEPIKDDYVSKAKVTSINYSVGITVEHKGEYHKFNAQEEWQLEDGCDVEKERELLWNHLKDVIDKNVEEVLGL